MVFKMGKDTELSPEQLKEARIAAEAIKAMHQELWNTFYYFYKGFGQSKNRNSNVYPYDHKYWDALISFYYSPEVKKPENAVGPDLKTLFNSFHEGCQDPESMGYDLALFVYQIHIIISQNKNLTPEQAEECLNKFQTDLIASYLNPENEERARAKKIFLATLNRRRSLQYAFEKEIPSDDGKKTNLTEILMIVKKKEKEKEKVNIKEIVTSHEVITDRYFMISNMLLDNSLPFNQETYEKIADAIEETLRKQGGYALYQLFYAIERTSVTPLNTPQSRGRFYGGLKQVLVRNAISTKNYVLTLEEFKNYFKGNTRLNNVLNKLAVSIDANRNYFYAINPDLKPKEVEPIPFMDAYKQTGNFKDALDLWSESQNNSNKKILSREFWVENRAALPWVAALVIVGTILGLASYGIIPAVGAALFTLWFMPVSIGFIGLGSAYSVFIITKTLCDKFLKPTDEKDDLKLEKVENDELMKMDEKKNSNLVLFSKIQKQPDSNPENNVQNNENNNNKKNGLNA